MKSKHLKITAFSTALFSSWFFVEDYDLLFDCGDGLSAGLLQKSRKIKNVFISHADRDHLAGLLQFNQLNARPGFPVIHYPADSNSFRALNDFTSKFDPHIKGTIWKGIRHGDQIEIKPLTFVNAFRNEHVKIDQGIAKSLSFRLSEHKWKIKKEFKNLHGSEIAKIANEKGKSFISEEIKDTILGYSGDTPVDNYEKWNNCKTLIHEATFINEEIKLNPNANAHSKLEEVIQMVSDLNIERLILCHFSSRYNQKEIDDAILKYGKMYKINIPIYRILPGEISKDVLSDKPVNY
jgi:ribonuclease Z